MNHISSIFAHLVILKTLFNFLRFTFVLAWRKFTSTEKEVLTEDSNISLTVLIPLLYESAICEQISLTAYQIVEECPNKVNVILICSGREKQLGKERTFLRLQSIFLKKSNDCIHLIETDGNDKCKADQLNIGIRYAKKNNLFKKGNDSWVGIYDADSIPQKGTIAEVISLALLRKYKAMQQAPLYVNRMERFNINISNYFSSLFCLSRALYSHIFSFKESFGFIFSGGLFDFRLNHLTGHGYFILYEYLEELGGFCPPSCDTMLGYKLSYAHQPIRLLRSYEESEIPEKITDFFYQGIVWFNGCEKYLEEFVSAKKKSQIGGNQIRAKIKILQVFLTNLSWSSLPIVWILVFLYSIINQMHLEIWGMAVAVWISFRYLAWLHLIWLAKENKNHLNTLQIFLVPITAPISVLFGCFPPLWFYTNKLIGTEINLKKTSRS